MKIEDIIKQIGDATALGDWRQVQSLAGTLKTRARDNGHGISGQAAMALVDALAHRMIPLTSCEGMNCGRSSKTNTLAQIRAISCACTASPTKPHGG